jgi:ABC-type antimicrobial peptide transport system permease subunit
VAAGLILGIGLAYGVARMLTAYLFGVSPTDVSIFAAVVGLLATAAGAALVPAIRATRVELLSVLRAD